MVLSETYLSKVKEIPTKEVAIDVSGTETDIKVEDAEIRMSQAHRMELCNKKTSRRRLEYDLRASQNVDAQSGANPTTEKGPPGTAIEININVDRQPRLSCSGYLTAQARISIAPGIVRVLELMLIDYRYHSHIPYLTTPGCTGSTKKTYGLRMPRSRACLTKSAGSSP